MTTREVSGIVNHMNMNMDNPTTLRPNVDYCAQCDYDFDYCKCGDDE